MMEGLMVALQDLEVGRSSSQGVPDIVCLVKDRLDMALQSFESAGSEPSDLLEVGRALLSRLIAADVPARIVTCLSGLDFEVQKDAARLFSIALRLGARLEAGECVAEYFASRSEICNSLLEGCGQPEVFTHCAEMLRCCARHPQVASVLLNEGVAAKLIGLAQHQSFDISSEAFSCLRELLLAQKAASASYLNANFEVFVMLYHELLDIEDYVTRRQSLRLLGEVLLDRSFMEFMLKYVGRDQFLATHMNLLRDSSKAIQLETFHILKVFVANPHKPHGVQQILHRNKDRLAKLLDSWCSRKDIDRPAADDLRVVVGILTALEAPVKS